MLVDFNNLNDESRIWIYPSEIMFNDEQRIFILNKISFFLQNWNAHQLPLKAGVKILENHFIVIALDESINVASGCSIDALQHTIQSIEKQLSITLMNRLNIFCVVNDIIKCIPIEKLSKDTDEKILFYDLTISKKGELLTYLKPMKQGWVNKFFV